MAGKSAAAPLLAKHRDTLVHDLDLNKVLPHLTQKGIFSYGEEREILLAGDVRARIDVFVELLSRKSLDSFHEFCAVLETTCPRILTKLLFDAHNQRK